MKNELKQISELITRMAEQKAPVKEIAQIIRYSVMVLDGPKTNTTPTRQDYKVDLLFDKYMA